MTTHDTGPLDRRRLLALGMLLGVAAGVVECVIVIGGYWFELPTPRDVRLLALFAIALDASIAMLATVVAGLLLGERRGWPLAAALVAFMVAAAHLGGSFPSLLERLGRPLSLLALLVVAAACGAVSGSVARRLPRIGHVRRRFLLPLLLLPLAFLPDRLPEAAGDGPSVLFVIIDTLRADRLGLSGAREPVTPFLDALARRGTSFAEVTTSSNNTTPAIASLLSSALVHTHGMKGFHHILDDRFVTGAELLAERGYRTFGFSSSFPAHLAYHQFDQGLQVRGDNTIPSLCAACPPVEGLARLAAFRLLEDAGWRALPQNRISATREADLTTGAALRFLQRDGATPFYGLLHYYDPHAPYSPPAVFSGYGKPLAAAGLGDLDGIYTRAGQPKPDWLERPVAVRDPEFPIRNYDGEISFVDHQLARIHRHLAGRGVASRTLWVVTADHGESLLEHDSFFKHNGPPYETVATVPLVMAGPRVPVDRVVLASARTVDVLPTLVDVLGLPRLSGVDGETLAALWEAREAGPRPSLVQAPHDGPVAIKKDDYKLLRRPGKALELYDLEADPRELANVVEARPEKLAELEEALARWTGQGRRGAGERTLDPEQIEILKSLGYLGGDGS